MRGITGGILMLVGATIAFVGIGLAVLPVVRMYQENLEDPLAMHEPEGRETGTDREKSVPRQMMRGVMVGAVGAVPFTVGSFLVKQAARRRLKAAMSASNRPQQALEDVLLAQTRKATRGKGG